MINTLEDYKKIWDDKISYLIKDISEVESNTIKEKPILTFESESLLVIYEINLYKNGYVYLKVKSMKPIGGKNKIQSTALIDTVLLDEILRLLSDKELQNEESCYEFVKGGSSEELTFVQKDNTFQISNHNCNHKKYSFAYQCLQFIILKIKNRIRESN